MAARKDVLHFIPLIFPLGVRLTARANVVALAQQRRVNR
jgi:hypothetical protein